MRPELLFPLFAEVTALTGVGPQVGRLLGKLGLRRVVDLLWHRPIGLIDRRARPTVAAARHGEIATIAVRVDEHLKPRAPGRPYRIVCSDPSGTLVLVFFHAREDYLLRTLPIGSDRVVSGKVELYGDEVQMTHPDHIVPPERADSIPPVEPVYPLTAGLSPKLMAKITAAAIGRLPDLPEWNDTALLARERWPAWKPAVTALHAPVAAADIDPGTPARRRLAYDELLASQLALLLVRGRAQRRGHPVEGDGRLRRRAIAALPYQLTEAQNRTLAEIDADLRAPRRMSRLLQGDVGSGKTVVAFLAMLAAVECGRQAALMAPTEILARQHFATLSPLAEAAGIRLALLTGRDKGKARERIISDLAEGRIDIVVGTHALVQADVVYRALAVAVVDEQHRFGVEQRVEIAGKGQSVDLLAMTATPIPRTLTLALYGDMDVSRLDEKPAGRKPVDTRLVSLERLEEVIAAIGRTLEHGNRAYWVCPLVEESEKVDLAAVEERHRVLAERFPGRAALVHGSMKAAARDSAMRGFAGGETPLLVATTVIEVGVDVPAATVMVVEQAERFGLAQLHQLRGRIGRGAQPGTCLLLYRGPLGETAKARLTLMRETDDGFRIAEEDLRLRGAGDLLGTRQSGVPPFRIASLDTDSDLLAIARDDARLVLERDGGLEGPRGAALRVLLHLFERDTAARLFQRG
ncbi:ATP-dependent DNA helicase RecG [Desertibaculum subflavum]|uniref:ATP-dependent DNA helicase RecG n=1 Tax=Desertibaculum subflavum TaxID=2268458 RepID=UPI000E673A83